MKYSSATETAAGRRVVQKERKYGAGASVPPRRPRALIIRQTDRCFSNDVVSRAELPPKRRSETLPGVDGGSPWGGGAAVVRMGTPGPSWPRPHCQIYSSAVVLVAATAA